MGLVEFLVQRRANVNHRNSGGNTALHFAMSYDTSGKMGEYLINNGADDTIENNNGASPCESLAALLSLDWSLSHWHSILDRTLLRGH